MDSIEERPCFIIVVIIDEKELTFFIWLPDFVAHCNPVPDWETVMPCNRQFWAGYY